MLAKHVTRNARCYVNKYYEMSNYK